MEASIKFVLEYFVLVHINIDQSAAYAQLMIHKFEFTGLRSLNFICLTAWRNCRSLPHAFLKISQI